jgi:CIC family chloride channel protein
MVAITCALAVILLKSFAHNIFVCQQNQYFLKLPFINSILPIAGILLTVFVIKNFLNGKLEKGSSRILYAVAKKGGILPKNKCMRKSLLVP